MGISILSRKIINFCNWKSINEIHLGPLMGPRVADLTDPNTQIVLVKTFEC